MRYILTENQTRNFHMRWIYGLSDQGWGLHWSWENDDGWYNHEGVKLTLQEEDVLNAVLNGEEVDDGDYQLREITESEVVMLVFESCTANS